MKKIKVYLQYPWAFPDSPYYKYLVENPPKNIIFENISKQKGAITNKSYFFLLTKLKINIRKVLDKLQFNIPNTHRSPEGNYNLIHCAHCLSKNKNKPWVSDIESVWSMWISGMNREKGKDKVKEILLQKNCKKIMPWTKYAKKEILKIFPEIRNKIEVVYPAVPLKNKKKNFRSKRTTITYVSRHFNLKGGEIALKVFSELKAKYGPQVEFIFISDNTSKETQIRYPLIKMQGLVNSKKLERIYEKSDILFYPSFVDTFGFAILEGMSWGLPVVALETKATHAVKEIIEAGKTGFLIDDSEGNLNKIKEVMLERLGRLIEDRKLRQKMSKACIEEIKNGKFSIKQRNKKLRKIYEEAIKK